MLPVFGFELLDLIWLVLHISNSGSFPRPLNSVQEHELITQKNTGDKTARNILIERNLRLVAHIVKKYCSVMADQDDLISIGTIGLIKAVDTFDNCKGVRLATYASRCIENEILMFFRSSRKLSAEISISEPIDTDKDGNALTLIDILCSDDTILDDIDRRIKSHNVREAIIKSLSDRERRIIELRYGLSGHLPKTQKEVAELLGISRSYVSRIEKKSIETLREILSCHERVE